MTVLDYLYTLSELTVSRIRYTLIAEETVTLDGDLSPTLRGAIWWAFALGQELGVGQQTNMGLGRYELETLCAEAHLSRYTEEA